MSRLAQAQLVSPASSVTAGNQEAVKAWDGVLFDRFARFRHIILPGLSAHGDRALELHPPQAGERVLEIGGGFGDAAQQIAAVVRPGGEVVGMDASPRFIETATNARNAAVSRTAVEHHRATHRRGAAAHPDTVAWASAVVRPRTPVTGRFTS